MTHASSVDKRFFPHDELVVIDLDRVCDPCHPYGGKSIPLVIFRRGLLPFCKWSMQFLTVDGILSNQAFRHKLDLNELKLQLLNQLKLGSGWEIKPKKLREFRHIIFAIDQQLAHLGKAKSWYIDGTFNWITVVKRQFQQLFTINAFGRSDDHAKQVPLVFVLMSGRKRRTIVRWH